MTEKRIILFYATWCGHCTRFKPIWDQFKEVYKKSEQEITDKYNVKLIIEEYDANKNPQKVEEENVHGFPTILIKYHDKTDNYIGPRTVIGLFKKLLQNPQDEEIEVWIKKVTDTEPYNREVNYQNLPQLGGYQSLDTRIIFADTYRKYLKYKKKYDDLFA